MTRAEAETLIACQDAVWADEILRDRGGSLSGEQAHALTLLATGDKKKADKAWVDAKKREVFGE